MKVANGTSRLYEIDALRFTAAFIVMLYHNTFVFFNFGRLSPVQYPLLEPFTKYGFLGVQIFFMISGYVVMMSAHGKTLKQFILSRAIRLYPAFWLACTCIYIYSKFFYFPLGEISIQRFCINMTMLHDFMGVRTIDEVYWTLTYEISFYFLVSLFISYNLMHRLVPIVSLWLLYTALAGPLERENIFSSLLFPRHSPLFAAGIILYLLRVQTTDKVKLCLLLVISYVLALRGIKAEMFRQERMFDASYSMPVISVIIGVSYAFMLASSFGLFDLSRYKWLKVLGDLTYPLYLLHISVGFVLFGALSAFVSPYLLLLLIIFVTMCLSYATNRLVEDKSRNLMRRVYPVVKADREVSQAHPVVH